MASIPGLFIGLACDRGMRSYTPHKQRRNDNQRGQGNHLNKAGDRFESGRKALLSLLRFVAFEIRFAYNALLFHRYARRRTVIIATTVNIVSIHSSLQLKLPEMIVELSRRP